MVARGDSTETVSPESLAELTRWIEPLAPGARVGEGRFEIASCMGRGGFGVVYRALDHRLGAPVALKLLRPDRQAGVDAARLEREARMARRLASERLVRVHDLVVEPGLVALVMELLPGGSLADRLAAAPARRLPPRAVGMLAVEMLEGLADLHRLDIVHRDVKPANVLFSELGRAKLGDFGLAVSLEPDRTRLTRDGGLPGTPRYLAPELWRGSPPSRRSDLYAVGVVLFEALTGAPPAVTEPARIAAELRRVEPRCPRGLRSLVVELLAPDPGDRPASAEQALRRLAERWPGGLGRRVAIAVVAALVVGSLTWRVAPALVGAGGQPTLSQAGLDLVSVSIDGEPRWRTPGRAKSYATGRFVPGHGPMVAGFPATTDVPRGAGARQLVLFDGPTGTVVRRRELEGPHEVFDALSDDYDVELFARDLDGDGYEELVICGLHRVYWPSEVWLYEPRVDRARTVMVAGGHHRYVGAVDLDGDGGLELLLGGVANRLGWYAGLAAIRLRPAVNQVESPPFALEVIHTPDFGYRPLVASSPLLWYALGPIGAWPSPSRATIDAGAEVIAWGAGEPRYRVDFAGFEPRSTMARAERERARAAAWLALQEATRHRALDDGSTAAAAAQRGADLATAADDRFLREWAERLRARSLVAAGQLASAERSFAALVATATSEAAALEIAHDAGLELLLQDRHQAAMQWFRRGLRGRTLAATGRGAAEFLRGYAMAAMAGGREAEARDVAAAFDEAMGIPGPFGDVYSAVLDWRAGSPPRAVPTAGLEDYERYLALELRLAAGMPLAALVADVEAERSRWFGSPAPLDLLEAELRWRLAAGDDPRVAALARRGWETLVSGLGSDPRSHGLLPLARERLTRLGVEAAEARRGRDRS